MNSHNVNINFKARYFSLGALTKETTKVWFVLHGYGQLAEYFLRKFKSLEANGVYCIAPEGLSRFYLEDASKRSAGGSQRVGATWMTREDRLVDIDNYLQYLNSIYNHEVRDRTDLDVTILGFSQGAATASRWVLDAKINFNRLILWAGMFPDDMNFEKGNRLLATKKVQLVYGTHDPFLNDQRLIHMQSLTDKVTANAEIIRFEGVHEIDEPTVLALL